MIKNENSIENINIIREAAKKMAELHENKHSIVYHLYEQVLTDKSEELNIDGMINCYAEMEIINKDAATIILNNILHKVDAMNKEDLELLEGFIAQKESDLEEFVINPWTKIGPQIGEEIARGNGVLSSSKKIEIADKYNEIYRKINVNNNIHIACLKIKEQYKRLKDDEEREQKKSPHAM